MLPCSSCKTQVRVPCSTPAAPPAKRAAWRPGVIDSPPASTPVAAAPVASAKVVDTKKPEPIKIEKPVETKKEEKAPSAGLPLPMIGGGIVSVIIVGIILFNVFSSGTGAGGNPNPDNANMRISYNENFFAIKNISENTTLNIAGLRIVGASSEPQGSNFGTMLEPSDCVFVKRGTASDSAVPSAWDCGGRARTTFQSQVFWRAETDSDVHFTVNNGNTTIETCNTVGIAVNNSGDNTCAMLWPEYQTND